jgi:hypothetical protein
MCRRPRTKRRGWYRPFRFSPIRIPAKPEFRVPRKGRAWPRARRPSPRLLRRRPPPHLQHLLRQHKRTLCRPRRRRRFGRQPHRCSQWHPLRRWERRPRRRLHPRPRQKRSTRLSSGRTRSGRQRPMHRPPPRRRSRRRQLRPRCGLRPLVPRHKLLQGPCPRRGLRPMARSPSCLIRTAPLRLRASVPRWRVRPKPMHRSAPRRRRRPAAAIPFRSPPSVARRERRRSFVRCGPSFRPSWAAASR